MKRETTMTNIDKLEQEQKELQEKVEQIGKTIAEMRRPKELCWPDLEPGTCFVFQGVFSSAENVKIRCEGMQFVYLVDGVICGKTTSAAKHPVIITDRNGKPL